MKDRREIGALAQDSMYLKLGRPSLETDPRPGETAITASVESIDNDRSVVLLLCTDLIE